MSARRAVHAATLLGAVILLAAPGARAHEVSFTVEQGAGVAVKLAFADGQPLAYAEVQVFSPADPALPFQKGRTDRRGYVAFVPDVAGSWRVKAADSTGHGIDTTVPVSALPGGALGVASERAAKESSRLVRPLAGALAIAAFFAMLVFAYRFRGKP